MTEILGVKGRESLRLVIMGLWVRVWSRYIGNLGVGSVGFRLAGQNRIQRAPYKWAFILGRYV